MFKSALGWTAVTLGLVRDSNITQKIEQKHHKKTYTGSNTIMIWLKHSKLGSERKRFQFSINYRTNVSIADRDGVTGIQANTGAGL